ncbi:hypothetical protein EYR38_001094 [Pleurotus pulmonarius]|nr:hypothetical protein EYR38_001094 [Pleurotus pulmonarius]
MDVNSQRSLKDKNSDTNPPRLLGDRQPPRNDPRSNPPAGDFEVPNTSQQGLEGAASTLETPPLPSTSHPPDSGFPGIDHETQPTTSSDPAVSGTRGSPNSDSPRIVNPPRSFALSAMRTTIEGDASQTDDTLPRGDSNNGQNTTTSSHILGHLLTTPITIAQVLTSFYRGRPMQRAVTLAPDALDGQVVSEHIEGRWYHDLDNVATYIGEDSGGRGRESPTPGHVHDVVLSQPLYERELSPLSLMDCDTAPLGNDNHVPVETTEIHDIVARNPIYSPCESQPSPRPSPLPEGLSPWQWYLPNDPLYQEARPRNENHQVLRMDPIDRLCDQVSGLAQAIQTDRQQLGDQIQGLVDAVQSDRRLFQDQIEALEQSPLRGDGSRRKGKPKRTSNPKRRPGDGVLLAAQIRSYFTYLVGGSHHLLKVSVSAEEADNYATLWNTDNGLSAPDCCDKDNFRYDVLGSPKSPWNRSAARVFVKAFEEWAGVELDQETTMEAVATWIKSLRQARRQSLLSRTQQEQEKCRARRQGRKRSVEWFL